MASNRFRTPMRGSRQGKSRRTEWFEGVGGVTPVAFTASSVSLLGSGIITNVGEETLIRTRGLLDIFLKTAGSAGDGFFGAIGIGLVSSAAFTGGIASVPTPITELAWDGWLWHTFFSVHGDQVSGEAARGSGHYRKEIDSKAMRIVEGEMTLYAAAEVVEVGVATMDIFLNTRFLSKLP